MLATTFVFAATLQLAVAHYQINVPEWRANSFLAPYNQHQYPCGGVPEGLPITNRTLWPLTGGSLELDLHHQWTYIFVNLGIGSNVTNFNLTLNDNGKILNETGNGTLCINKFMIPSKVSALLSDGMDASLQVITVGGNGAALYNCADIKFTSNATLLPASSCSNSSNVRVEYLANQVNGTAVVTPTNTTTAANTSTTAKSGAAGVYGEMKWGSGLLVGVMAGVMAFVL